MKPILVPKNNTTTVSSPSALPLSSSENHNDNQDHIDNSNTISPKVLDKQILTNHSQQENHQQEQQHGQAQQQQGQTQIQQQGQVQGKQLHQQEQEQSQLTDKNIESKSPNNATTTTTINSNSINNDNILKQQELTFKAKDKEHYDEIRDLIHNLIKDKPVGIVGIITYKEIKKELTFNLKINETITLSTWKINNPQQYYLSIQKNWNHILKALIYLNSYNISLIDLNSNDLVKYNQVDDTGLMLSLNVIFDNVKEINKISLLKLDRILVHIDNKKETIFKNNFKLANDLFTCLDNPPLNTTSNLVTALTTNTTNTLFKNTIIPVDTTITTTDTPIDNTCSNDILIKSKINTDCEEEGITQGMIFVIEDYVNDLKNLISSQVEEVHRVLYVFPKYEETHYTNFHNNLTDLLYKLNLPRHKDYQFKSNNMEIIRDNTKDQHIIITQRVKSKYRLDEILNQPELFSSIFNNHTFHIFLINLLKNIYILYNDTLFNGKLTLEQIYFSSPNDISIIDTYTQWLYPAAKNTSNNGDNDNYGNMDNNTTKANNTKAYSPNRNTKPINSKFGNLTSKKSYQSNIFNTGQEQQINPSNLSIIINNVTKKKLDNTQASMISSFFGSLHHLLTTNFSKQNSIYPIDLSFILKLSLFRCHQTEDLKLFEEVCSLIDMEYNNMVYTKYSLRVKDNIWGISHINIDRPFIGESNLTNGSGVSNGSENGSSNGGTISGSNKGNNMNNEVVDKRNVNHIFCQIESKKFKEFKDVISKYQAYLDYFIFFTFDSLDIHVLILSLDLQSLFDMKLMPNEFKDWDKANQATNHEGGSTKNSNNYTSKALLNQLEKEKDSKASQMNNLDGQLTPLFSSSNSPYNSNAQISLSHNEDHIKSDHPTNPNPHHLRSSSKSTLHNSANLDKRKKRGSSTKGNIDMSNLHLKNQLYSSVLALSASPHLSNTTTNNNEKANKALLALPLFESRKIGQVGLMNNSNCSVVSSSVSIRSRMYLMSIVNYAVQLLQFWYFDIQPLIKGKNQTCILSTSCHERSNNDSWEDEIDYLTNNLAKILNIQTHHPTATATASGTLTTIATTSTTTTTIDVIGKIIHFFEGISIKPKAINENKMGIMVGVGIDDDGKDYDDVVVYVEKFLSAGKKYVTKERKVDKRDYANGNASDFLKKLNKLKLDNPFHVSYLNNVMSSSDFSSKLIKDLQYNNTSIFFEDKTFEDSYYDKTKMNTSIIFNFKNVMNETPNNNNQSSNANTTTPASNKAYNNINEGNTNELSTSTYDNQIRRNQGIISLDDKSNNENIPNLEVNSNPNLNINPNPNLHTNPNVNSIPSPNTLKNPINDHLNTKLNENSNENINNNNNNNTLNMNTHVFFNGNLDNHNNTIAWSSTSTSRGNGNGDSSGHGSTSGGGSAIGGDGIASGGDGSSNTEHKKRIILPINMINPMKFNTKIICYDTQSPSKKVKFQINSDNTNLNSVEDRYSARNKSNNVNNSSSNESIKKMHNMDNNGNEVQPTPKSKFDKITTTTTTNFFDQNLYLPQKQTPLDTELDNPPDSSNKLNNKKKMCIQIIRK